MIVISSDIVLKPLPGIACLRGQGALQSEIEADGTAKIQIEADGTQQQQTIINGGWQRCPSRDNTA